MSQWQLYIFSPDLFYHLAQSLSFRAKWMMLSPNLSKREREIRRLIYMGSIELDSYDIDSPRYDRACRSLVILLRAYSFACIMKLVMCPQQNYDKHCTKYLDSRKHRCGALVGKLSGRRLVASAEFQTAQTTRANFKLPRTLI